MAAQVMAGYSATPLERKLGIRQGMCALLVDVPEHLTAIGGFDGYSAIATDPADTSPGSADYVHGFFRERALLEQRAPGLRLALSDDGMCWISWPKKASGVRTDITEDVLREVLLPTGLVDIKVCAVDETWSGLKFVIRKELRKR